MQIGAIKVNGNKDTTYSIKPIESAFVGDNALLDEKMENVEKTFSFVKNVNQGNISSNTYEIKNNYISKISPDTNVSKLKSNLSATGEIVIKDAKGNLVNDNSTVATGMKLSVGNETYTIVVKGDMNGDGTADITDLAKICLHYIEKSKLKNEYEKAADVNGDESVDITDIAQLQMVIIGKRKI